MSVRVFGTCFMQEGIPALDVGNTFQRAGAPELNQKGGSEQKAQYSSLLLSNCGCSVTSHLICLPPQPEAVSPECLLCQEGLYSQTVNQNEPFHKLLFSGLLSRRQEK